MGHFQTHIISVLYLIVYLSIHPPLICFSPEPVWPWVIIYPPRLQHKYDKHGCSTVILPIILGSINNENRFSNLSPLRIGMITYISRHCFKIYNPPMFIALFSLCFLTPWGIYQPTACFRRACSRVGFHWLEEVESGDSSLQEHNKIQLRCAAAAAPRWTWSILLFDQLMRIPPQPDRDPACTHSFRHVFLSE